MTIYTVHAPPLRGSETAPDPERFVFIRDGFSFWAFVFAPLWLLWRRLWLALLFYVAIIVVLEGGMWLLRVPYPARSIVIVLISLLIGMEAGSIRRWTLERRDWRQLGVVTGNNHEAAERRFFDTWVAQMAAPRPPVAPPQPMSPNMRVPPDASDIIGLFPEPQSRQ
jgi:uncharacterized protein DUF2628